MCIVTSNNYKFYFDEGKFDEWCVYCRRPDGSFALDKQYLYWIKKMSQRYGKDRVYNDFLKIYDIARYDYDFTEGLNVIKEVSDGYPVCTEQWWCVFYMTMIAECRKEGTILNKRIKRLGVYNVIFDGYGSGYTANYMKKLHWWELDELMRERGF